MKKIELNKSKDLTSPYNRLMYVLFFLLACYFLFFSKSYESAMTYLGIALIFDPFRQEVPWSQRPLYQRIWLLTHLSCVFILLGVVLFF